MEMLIGNYEAESCDRAAICFFVSRLFPTNTRVSCQRKESIIIVAATATLSRVAPMPAVVSVEGSNWINAHKMKLFPTNETKETAAKRRTRSAVTGSRYLNVQSLFQKKLLH